MSTKTKKSDKPSLPVCDICCEQINKSTRKQIVCPFCNKACCLGCNKTFLTSTLRDPHCMHCNTGWNQAFLRNNFPASWLNKEYKELRERMLFDLELAKIPDTQRFCEAAKQRQTLLEQRITLSESLQEARDQIKSMKKQYEDCNADIWLLNESKNEQDKVELEFLKDKSHALYQDIKRLDAELEDLDDNIRACNTEIAIATALIEGNEPINRENKFLLHCPGQGCKGFIEANWKCGLCAARICSGCHEKKEDFLHECKPENKASVEALKADTKPCPKCGALIHKISGCDQMWCTQCHTAFSWHTGALEKQIHNPHYYEWMRQNEAGADNPEHDQDRPDAPEQELGQECVGGHERFVTEASTFTLVQKIRERVDELQQRDVIMNLVRLLIHITDVEMPNALPQHVRSIPHDPNRLLRIRYMLNEISEAEFMSALVKREKDRLKRDESSQIIQMFLDVSDDMLRRFLNDGNTKVEQFLTEMENLRQYTNQSLQAVGTMFHSKYRTISPDFADISTSM